MIAGWTSFRPHPNGKQYRLLRDNKGKYVYRQWYTTDGPCYDMKNVVVNPDTVDAYLKTLQSEQEAAPRTSPTVPSNNFATSSITTTTGSVNYETASGLGTCNVLDAKSTSASGQKPPSEDIVGFQDVDINKKISLEARQGNMMVKKSIGELATVTSYQDLGNDFSIQHRDFFVVGRVFRVLWSETKGSNSASKDDDVHQTLRPMVVVQQHFSHCICLPVHSYGDQGVAKPGLRPQEIGNHAIIYMEDNQPELTAHEQLLNPSMRDPIAVKPFSSRTLRNTSRLRYDIVCTVQYNVKVSNLGRVTASHRPLLNRTFLETIGGS